MLLDVTGSETGVQSVAPPSVVFHIFAGSAAYSILEFDGAMATDLNKSTELNTCEALVQLSPLFVVFQTLSYPAKV